MAVSLFNPRSDIWRDHFVWSVDRIHIIGLTPTGRATVSALALNRMRIIDIRAADLAIGRHPPPADPIQYDFVRYAAAKIRDCKVN